MAKGTSRRRSLLETYKWMIIALMLLTVAGALLTVFIRPAEYVSTAGVVVRPELLGGGTPAPPNMGTERQIALSGDVTSLAAQRLGLDPETAQAGLSVDVPIDSTVLEFSYSSSAPDTAVERVGAFARAYVAFRTDESETRPTKAFPVAEMISDPTTPSAPTRPNLPLVLGLSLMVGATLGAGSAFAWDRLSGKFRGIDDVEAQTGLPVLARLPVLVRGVEDEVAVLGEHPGRVAQTFGYLAAHLLHELDTRKAHVLLVTSPSRAAGKTTVATNLSVSFAAAGRETVLISAELGSPSAHELFGVDRNPGLGDVATGSVLLGGALHATGVPGLRLATCGSSTGRTDSILNPEDLGPLLDKLSMPKSVVVIDAPSILGRPETALLADTVDLVLVVVDMRHDGRDDTAAAIALLSHVGDRIVGTLANDPGRYRKRRSLPTRPVGVRPPPAPDRDETATGARAGAAGTTMATGDEGRWRSAT